jgi:uroporphyrinogen-III decarboxylase
MFGPSEKSVPGCLVSIVPTLIGEPVAALPGVGPHFEVSTLVPEPVEPLDPLELDVLELVLGAAGLLVVELLPQAARTRAPATAASKTISRVRGHSWNFLTSLSSFGEGTPAPVGQVRAAR